MQGIKATLVNEGRGEELEEVGETHVLCPRGGEHGAAVKGNGAPEHGADPFRVTAEDGDDDDTAGEAREKETAGRERKKKSSRKHELNGEQDGPYG